MVGLLTALTVGVTGSAAVYGAPAPSSAKTGTAGQTTTGTSDGEAGAKAAKDAAAIRQQQDELAGDIDFSVPSGTFQGQVSVTLSTSVANAQIRYTTDGTLPTASSALYSGALNLTATTQLRAQAFVNGAASGEPGTAIYLARAANATTAHDLPVLVLDDYGAGKPGRDWVDTAAMLMEPQGGTTSLGATPTLATRAAFHLRGQSSSNFEKAPYRLELRDNQDDDADYPMLGMPAESDWVLRGPFPDKSLVRDAFAYTLGQELGLKAPRHRFVEVYTNLDGGTLGSEDYQGVYLLDETIKNQKDRLDLKQLDEEDTSLPEISGGYIFKFDAFAAEEPKLVCTGAAATCWNDLEVVDPEPLNSQQQQWLTQYVQKFHDSLRSANPSDPQTGYPAYIDVDSFVNQIILNELARQGDGYIRSQYFHKDRDGKIFTGPLWDYDIGFGAVPGADAIEGWQFRPFSFPGMPPTTDWFLRLMEQPEFQQRVRTRWQELRQGVLSDAQLRARVSRLASPLTNAAQRNFTKWPNLNSRMVGGFQTKTSQTWQQQLTILQDWLVQRAAWIDSSGWDPSINPNPGWPPQPGKEELLKVMPDLKGRELS
ncbi:CotH kinase family protein [Streptomyces carminius]|uniref:CotH kinase family protein n=1 Tax=Streptomyces carminius TaxID=2665496 RepID=UPI0018EC9A1A|nr:CotH kinase family protein [Streptomyces carminius]